MINATLTKDRLILLLFAILLVSVIYSKFALSLSMIGLTIISWLHIEGDKIFILPNIKNRFLNAIKSPVTIGLLIVFAATLISGINSSDTGEWLRHVKMRLPFLFLPVAFMMLPKVDTNWYHRTHYMFIGIMLLSSIPVLSNFIANRHELIEMIGKGKTIPTPINHIKYSLFLALAIVSGIVLYARNFSWKYKWERYILAAAVIYLFVLIHVLAVRSGIVVLYLCLGFLLLRYIITSRNYIRGLAAILALAAIPAISYYSVPSFTKKIDYMVYDMKMYSQGKGANYSDSERLRSYQVGNKLFQENLLLGTGIGDLYAKCVDTYVETFGKVQVTLYPHNQFLFILAGMGLLGLILFTFGFTLPLIYRGNYKESLFLCLYIVLLTSFLVENTMERSYSTGFFVFFIVLGLNYLNGTEISGNIENKEETH